MNVQLVKEYRQFEGRTVFYKHHSRSTSGEMKFSAYLPYLESDTTYPVLIWLSGFTYTEENFIVKPGVQR